MKYYLIILVFFLGFSSCRNETSQSIQSAKDYLVVSTGVSAVVPQVVNSSKDLQYLKHLLAHQADSSNTCATYSYINGDTVNMVGPLFFDIDFHQGCSDNDGVNKAGIVSCSLFSPLSDLNGVCEVNFDGFRLDNHFIWGGLTIQCKDDRKWKVITQDLRFQNGKKSIAIVDTLLFNMVAGDSSQEFGDDEFLFSSNGSMNFSVNGYSHDLCKKYSCSWLTQGFLELNVEDQSKQIVNLGSNDCDNEAVLIIGGEEYFIEMH